MNIPYSAVRKFDYEPMPAWGKDDDGHVWFRCKCGQLNYLDDWEIDGTGKVSPSVWHDEDHCGFHEFIQLDGFDAA